MKKQPKNNPFINLQLDPEEQALENAFERGEFEESDSLETTKKMLQEAAQRHQELHNTKPVTIRIKQLDLLKVKAKAKRNQIPYQTLLGVLIHEYAEGDRELVL